MRLSSLSGRSPGHRITMSEHNEPTLDDVMIPTEEAHPDHKEHAKTPKHLDDSDLDARTEHERNEVN
jgi:hypothetical protein